MVKPNLTSDYLALLRPKQWIKNLFIAIPAFFAGSILSPSSLGLLLLGFVCFSLAASVVYIINDMCDIEEDGTHPTNKLRPLASGKVTTTGAVIAAVCLFVFASLGTYFYLPEGALFVLLLYVGLNVLYSLKIKQIAVLDVFIISFGFVLRTAFGGLIVHEPVSNWLVLMIFLISLFMAFVKRRSDFILAQGSGSEGRKSRKSLGQYNLPFLDAVVLITAATTLICYIQYTFSSEVMERVGSDYLYISAISPLYGIIRYLQQTYVFNNGRSPTGILWTDRHIQSAILLWLAFFAYLLYF